MNELLGNMIGVDNARSIDGIGISLSEFWAGHRAFWLWLAAVALLLTAVFCYRRWQDRGSWRARTALGLMRGSLLGLLLLTLAAPVLRLTVTSIRAPTLFVIIDGTDSMAIEDDWPEDQRAALHRAVEAETATLRDGRPPRSRIEFVRALLLAEKSNLLSQIQKNTGARVEAFVFDGRATSQLRRLNGEPSAVTPPLRAWADQLTTSGQVTALGAALDDIRGQPGAANLAGVILFSDFAHNSGPTPIGPSGIGASGVGAGGPSAAGAIGVPVHAVGCGAVEALDLAVELQTDLKLKKAERTNIVVKLRQTGLAGRSATVRVVARHRSGDGKGATETLIGETVVPLAGSVESVDFPYTPEASGTIDFVATVESLQGEVVAENNQALRQVQVIDDFLRLLYVAYEPEWEWRFLKEVFHRDKLVGMEGFRTYLSSSDPRVREANPLFVATLTPARSNFFTHDVLFLGDMPASALNARFGELVREFVGQLGGGLVVLAGPRFGPRELLDSPFAELLPVVIDPSLSPRDERPFRLRRTAGAAMYPFMQLGESVDENELAWNNLGELPWYQPAAALREQAVVLAEHPTDKLSDGKTPQPLIATRQFGKGEVVYLAFNEIWRLRRKYGEKYYRQFWSQLIYRLGMSHALGDGKRFVPRTDRSQYRVDDFVTFSVDAYDGNYEALTDDSLPAGGLAAEVTTRARGSSTPDSTPLVVPLLRPGLFQTQFAVRAAGDYTIRVQDPVTGNYEERRVEVQDISAERRRVVRDIQLQEEIARQTGGRSYDLTNVADLPGELQLEPIIERSMRSHSLVTTPLWFVLVVGLMVSEWLLRRAINLP